jgi:hypothetical protein
MRMYGGVEVDGGEWSASVIHQIVLEVKARDFVSEFCRNVVYKPPTTNMVMVQNVLVMPDKFNVDELCT